MTDLVAHIREVIDQHAKPDRHDGGDSVVAVERRTYPTTPVMWRKRSSTGLN